MFSVERICTEYRRIFNAYMFCYESDYLSVTDGRAQCNQTWYDKYTESKCSINFEKILKML